MGVRVPDCSSSVQIVELGLRGALSKLSRMVYCTGILALILEFYYKACILRYEVYLTVVVDRMYV